MRRYSASVSSVVVSVLVFVGVVRAQPLPTDPRITQGVLPTGMRYVVMEHKYPPGRAALWLHVSTGSLNETDRQRGIAHYLEHMAFNGSKNFPPDTVVPFFQSLGLTFGQHQNAFTSFDQTSYQLFLQDNAPETVSKGLTFLSDVATGLLLKPEEVEKERQVILEERRTGLSAQQRVQDYIFERMIPGSLFGLRLPIGTEETISSVQEPDFRAYYSTWYVPSNMTFLMVADMPVGAQVELIRKHFAPEGAAAAVPAPKGQDVGVKPYAAPGAIVASDPELTDAEVQVLRVDLPQPAVTDLTQYRRDVVEGVANWIVNRRMSARVDRGQAAYLGAGATTMDLFNSLRYSGVSATGKPENWRAMLTDVAADMRRAVLHGFTEREVDDARKELLASAERAVETEPTRPARSMLSRMNARVAAGEPIMSAGQELEIVRGVLPGVTAAEAWEAFKRSFDTPNVMFIVTLPSSAVVPTEAELLEAGVAAWSASPEKEAEQERPASMLTAAPAGGAIAERVSNASTGVTSLWLANGVRVHYKFNDYKKDQVTVSINLAGGAIEETAATKGLTTAAAIAWDKPASRTRTSTQVRDLMTGKKVSVSGGPGEDTFNLGINGSPGEIEAGFELAYLLLTEPVVEPAAFDNWKTEQKQAIEQRDLDPRGGLSEELAETLYPANDVRFQPMELSQLDAITLDASQAWLDRLVTTAPIEAAIVGDIPEARAVELAAKYLGSLPTRPRIGPDTLKDKRGVAHLAGPVVGVREMKTQTPVAIVVGGFFGTDQSNIRDSRLLGLAARVLTTRMIKTIREDMQLVYSISANSRPGSAYPGWGMFMAGAPTEPAKAKQLATTMHEMYVAFSDKGPTEEELTVARNQTLKSLDEQMKEPNWWMSWVSSSTLRGIDLEEVLAGPKAYESFTTSDVLDAYNRYFTPTSTFTVTVTPDATGAQPETAPAK